MTLDEYDLMKSRAERAEAEVERLRADVWNLCGYLHNHDICIICGEKWKDSCFDHEETER